MKILKRFFHIIFATADRRVDYYIKALSYLKRKNYRAFGLIVSRRLQRKYGVFLPYNAEFDSTLVLRHPVGVIIGEGVKIGKHVTIFQNVTLGRSDTHIPAYPAIGSNTIIYAGAVVLGDITIGNNCVVAANAVVTKNIPDDSIAVGVPAKILKKDKLEVSENSLIDVNQ